MNEGASGGRSEGLELMYLESELIVKTLVTLANEGIPAYPVHDCLICRVKDKDRVVGVLRSQMKEQLGLEATLDIEEDGKEPVLLRPLAYLFTSTELETEPFRVKRHYLRIANSIDGIIFPLKSNGLILF